MTNLILLLENDKLHCAKTILDVDDWRAIGITANNTFMLITRICNLYYIKDLTIKRFNELIHTGVEITCKGTFHGVVLACSKCGGLGITDWISDVTGVIQKSYSLHVEFKRDPDLPSYKTTTSYDGKPLIIYYSRALASETQQHCKECKGTGLFRMARIMQSEIVEHKF